MTVEKKQRILISNLREFCKRENLAKQQKKLTVSELAKLYCDIHSNTDDILKSLNEITLELSASDKIIFLSELCHLELSTKIKNMLFIGSAEPTSAGAHSKISYLKNKYNDEAFEHFSHSIANAKPDYASSFNECCENVFDGRCEYCILPIMNSRDGRLMSFYTLLDRYELKICDIIDIDGENTSSTFRHALISRSCKENQKKIQKNQKYVFEFSIISDTTDFFAPLLEAANQISATLTCIDSIPTEYAPHVHKFFISFSIPSQNALAFRLFVSLIKQTYVPLGIYKET
ncbi:MAG: hypothetical protein E7678_01280 [Ruminococcaceae bacterium]|nr:hypothetical protein [Oscillospiraceae bacterium]